jgi:hypothetical protein
MSVPVKRLSSNPYSRIVIEMPFQILCNPFFWAP